MLSNHAYNLLLQAAEEHKSLWRIKDDYKKDADGCEECKAFWTKIEKDKEAHIAELEALLKKHI